MPSTPLESPALACAKKTQSVNLLQTGYVDRLELSYKVELVAGYEAYTSGTTRNFLLVPRVCAARRVSMRFLVKPNQSLKLVEEL